MTVCVNFSLSDYTYSQVDKILVVEKWKNRSALIEELIQIGIKYRDVEHNA